MLDKKLLGYAGAAKKRIRQSVCWNLLKLLGMICFYMTIAYFISSFFYGQKINWVLGILVLVASFLLRQFSIQRSVACQAKLVSDVKASLRKAIFEKVQKLGLGYAQVVSTSDVINMGVDTIEQLENYYGRFVTEYYTCLFSGALLFIAIAPMSLKVALVLLALTPIIPLMLRGILGMVTGKQKKYWRRYQDIGGLFLDSLQGLTTLKIFGADEKRAGELRVKSELFRKETMKILTMQLNSITLVEWIAFGGTIAGMLMGIGQLRSGAISLFAMLVIFFLSSEVFRPMMSLTSSFHVAMTGVAAGKKMQAFLEAEMPEVYGEASLPDSFSIFVDKLTYQYPTQDHNESIYALKEISCEFKFGELTALVGPSGCGKSTLAKLICAEMLPPAGTLYYGHQPDRHFSAQDIAKNMTRVSHQGHIFEGTIRSNLLFGRENATDMEMEAVLDRVQLTEEIRQRGGLDCPTASGGIHFSGGQRQRLCLARALLHESRIYVFDEATSNIDRESEEIILRIIEELKENHGVIMITHRLKNIEGANQIYVLDKGCIVQQGTHSDLIMESGKYQKLYEEQARIENFRK